MRRWIAFAAVAALFVPLAAGCSPNVITGAGDPTHPVVGVLNDTSCDESPRLVHEGRQLLVSAISEAAPLEGTVLADVIQQRAPDTNSFPVMKTFKPSPDVPPGNNELAKEDLERQARVLIRRSKNVFRRRPNACRTDAFGAFLLMGLALETKSPKVFRLLVVVSNGVVVDDEHDFRRGVLTPRQVDRTIRDLRSQGLIPDLRGVHVALVGVGHDPIGYSLTTAQEQGLYRFWRRYVAASGATLVYMLPRMTDLPPFR
jgi:hypothetical protein